MVDLKKIAELYNLPIEEFIIDEEGNACWVCKHNVNHIVKYPRGGTGVHECDGCCFKLKKKSVKRKIKCN